MVAIGDVFATPIGFAALAAAIPTVLLYLIKPDPAQLTLPTFRFLGEEAERSTTSRLFRRLRQNLLLLVQLLAIVAFAAALASPFVLVSESQTVEETVIVVDAGASMQTQLDDGTTRLDRALVAAEDEVTERTSVVVAHDQPSEAAQRVTPAAARDELASIEPVDVGSDLRGAITRATSLAGEDARVLVYSDFATDGWERPVRTARAQGYRVSLQQFAGGGTANVGITGRSFTGGEVRLTVTNYGDESVTREVTLGSTTETVDVGPESAATVTMAVPSGGAEATIESGDGFPVDDVVAVGAPQTDRVSVLLVTNRRNPYLETALDVNPEIDLRIAEPPAPDASPGDHDVILFSNVDPGRLLGSTVQDAERAVRNGAGVGVQAQTDLHRVEYGDLLLLDQRGSGTEHGPSIRMPTDTELNAGIRFPPPENYLVGSVPNGSRVHVGADDSPLIATGEVEAGRVLYYGYLEETSAPGPFTYHYQYPVFWKRAVRHLADRTSHRELTRQTGDQLRLGTERTVTAPDGDRTGTTVRLDRVGWYEVGDRRYGASLFDPDESGVTAEPLEARDVGPSAGAEELVVPFSLTHWAALAVLALAIVEVGVLRRRGDV